MSKYFVKLFLSMCFILSYFNFSFAQNYDWFVSSSLKTNTTTTVAPTIVIPTTINASSNSTPVTPTSFNNTFSVQIPQNVLSVISNLKNKYFLNDAQVSSLNQIARSYQYIFTNPPQNKNEAYILSIRDVAAINCASVRILGQALDEASSQIENASIDNQNKKNSYDRYSGLLNENTPNPQILEACEDQYTNTTNITNTTGDNFEIKLNGVVPDSSIVTGCLVLTNFMKFGSSGPQVTSLQNFLMQNGYLEMYPTGYFGRNTEFAVKEWQKRHNLDIRGWTGPNTRGTIAGVTCKNQSSYDKAFNGSASVQIVTKNVLAKTPLTQNIKPSVQNTSSEIKSSSILVSSSNTSNSLSSISGNFYLKRNPVNSLYFTYKANANIDDIFICIAKDLEDRCQSSNNFIKIKQKYEPGNIDFINNNTKWIFNVYYNVNNWGNVGGNIYLRNGINNISEVYSVKISDSI